MPSCSACEQLPLPFECISFLVPLSNACCKCGRKDGQGMGLGVENPLVEPESVLVGEEEVEVLERLCQPEAAGRASVSRLSQDRGPRLRHSRLHAILSLHLVCLCLYVPDAAKCTRPALFILTNPGRPHKRLKDEPTPLSIDDVAGQVKGNKERLDRLGAENVASVNQRRSSARGASGRSAVGRGRG